MFSNFLDFPNFYIKLSNFAVVLFSYFVFSINENTDTYLPQNLPLSWNGFRKILVSFLANTTWKVNDNNRTIFFAHYCEYFFLRTAVNFTLLYPQAWWARLPRFTQPWSSFYLETRLQEKYHRTDGLLATSSKHDKRRPVMESARGLQPITTAKYRNVDDWIYSISLTGLLLNPPANSSEQALLPVNYKIKSAVQLSAGKGTATEKPL